MINNNKVTGSQVWKGAAVLSSDILKRVESLLRRFPDFFDKLMKKETWKMEK